MAKAVGLDIGSRTVKLVEIDGSPKKFRITQFVSREIPGDGGAAEGEIVGETVAEVLKAAKVRSDSLIAAMDSKSVVIREITVPFLQDDQIRRVLRFEAEAHLHNYAIEDVIVDYVKVGEAGEESKILIFAAPKERVRASPAPAPSRRRRSGCGRGSPTSSRAASIRCTWTSTSPLSSTRPRPRAPSRRTPTRSCSTSARP